MATYDNTDLVDYATKRPNFQSPTPNRYQPTLAAPVGGEYPTSPVPGPTEPAPIAAPPQPSMSAADKAAQSQGNMPAGIDPALAQIYRNAGVTPADRGSGFFDWQYWQGVGPSQYARLAADLAGTGTDQPTGTPGQGPWSNSGRNQPGVAVPGGVQSRYFMDTFGGAGSRNEANPLIPGGSYGSGAPGDLLQYLMGRGTGSITDDSMANLQVTGSTPIIKNQTNAFRAEQDRAVRNALSSAAEKGNASSNLDAVSRSLNEKAGQATSTFETQAMAHEIDARRQEIQQALQLGTSYLTEQQRMALQRELTQLNIASQQFMQLRDLQERGYEFDVNDQFRNSPLYGG